MSISFYEMICLSAGLCWLWQLIYAGRRLVWFLHMAQQNSYRPERYWRWLRPRFFKEIPWGDIAAIVLMCFGCWYMFYGPAIYSKQVMCGFIALPLAVFFIQGLIWRRGAAKKPLVWTARAKRLYAAALLPWALLLLIQPALMLTVGWYAYWLPLNAVLTALLPLQMLVAVAWRYPLEEARNRRFVAEAAKILQDTPNLLRVGITGSYGKTSSKVLLGRVLSEGKYTLVTPDSYNTPMGITLTVRNMLKPIHQVFVAEMGARQTGDIKELCDIVQPQIGILTAIGPQHLETFKTLENVAATKFELIDSLPQDGLAVLNLDDPQIAARAAGVAASCKTYGLERQDVDYTARDIRFSPQGMDFVLQKRDGTSQPMHTRLLGRHNVYNILAAAAVAEHLGLSLAEIARAVAQQPPVPHRLEMKRAGSFTIIDDAFNANPAGSKAAVDVLAAMPGGRKLIITPGMVELGSEQARLNREFAQYCAEHLDYVVIVGQKISEPLVEGLQGMPRDCWHVAADLAEASAFMRSWVRPGDYVLFENDLPDSYL